MLSIDHSYFNNLIFHPRKSWMPVDTKDFKVAIDSTTDIYSRIHIEDKNFPLIVHYHGNAEISDEYDPFAVALMNRKINFISCDYRGYGKSGGVPSCSSILEDSTKMFSNLLKYLVSIDYNPNIYIMGRSLGSACALEIASKFESSLKGIIIESGFYSEKPLFDLFGLDPKQFNYVDESNGFNNKEKAMKCSIKSLVIHAKEDHILPLEQGVGLNEFFSHNEKIIVPVERANHNNLLEVMGHDYFRVIKDFIYR